MRGRLVKGPGRVVPEPVVSASEQAARILAEVDAEAARRRATLGALEEEARRRGHAEGLAAGREAALAEMTDVLVAARADAEEVRRSSRDAAAKLGRRMAEKIVGRTLELHPTLLAEMAAAALAASRVRSGPVVLRVHPEDVAIVEQERPRLVARLAASVELRMVGDATVGRHGCVVESPTGRLDARLEAQLDALEGALGARKG
jgi:flagellar biosynthesis/type III secretory pathway protein FliH